MVAAFELPGGLHNGSGPAIRNVELRRLTGEDEAWLASLDPSLPAAHVVTGLLARCTVRLGDQVEPGANAVRQLLVGDRDYLLLALRQLSNGSHFDGMLVCPACGEKMDLSFDAGDIPLEQRPQTASHHEVEVQRRDGSQARVVFRLPSGADQEALSGLAPDDPGRALLARCIKTIDGKPVRLEDLDSLEAAGIDQLDELIERLSPTVELAMRIACPSCGQHFDADYDLVQYLLEELRLSASQLAREVHNLAYYYHWPLREILALTSHQRREYVSLIGDERLRQEG